MTCFSTALPQRNTVNLSRVHKTQRTPPLVAKEWTFTLREFFWLFWMNLELFTIYSGLYPLMLLLLCHIINSKCKSIQTVNQHIIDDHCSPKQNLHFTHGFINLCHLIPPCYWLTRPTTENLQMAFLTASNSSTLCFKFLLYSTL